MPAPSQKQSDSPVNDAQDARLIVVHSMGKVGSSTLYAPLRDIAGDRAFHTHQFNEKTLDHFISNVSGVSAGHIRDSLRFLELLPAASSVKLIIPVREPMSRNVSAFFENLERYGIQHDSTDVRAAIDTFLRRYPHQVPVNWFNLQVKLPLGIDALQAAPGIPYRFLGTPFELLNVRVEDADQTIERQLNEFLDTTNLKLKQANVGDQKPYAALYAAFRREFQPPKALVDTLYEADYVRALYSTDEIREMRSRWEQPSTD